jgi:hypothetical protein
MDQEELRLRRREKLLARSKESEDSSFSMRGPSFSKAKSE